MAKGAGCAPEFRAKAVGLLTESRGSCSSETRAVDQVAGDPGVAPETLRRWSDKTGAAVAAETRQSAGDAMAELRGSRAEAARLGRVNGILTAASAFSRPGSARHGVDGRLRRRVQGPFRGRASRRGAGRPAGLRVRHAMRLTGPDPDTRQPHGRRARGAGPRHPRGPCRFLHGRVRVPQDARPVVGAGPGSGRDRPRLGDGHHAGTGSPRRAPRRDVRHRQTGEGARAAGPDRLHVAGIACVRMANGRFGCTAPGRRRARPRVYVIK